MFIDRFKANRRSFGLTLGILSLSMTGLLAGCGAGGSSDETAAFGDATAVSANVGAYPHSDPQAQGDLKAANSKVEPKVRPGAEAPLDSAPGSAHGTPGGSDLIGRPAATRLFASGFENGVALTEPAGYRLADRQLVGSDIAGFNFPMDFWATPSHWRNWVLSTVGEVTAEPVTDSLTAALKTVTGRDGTATRALSLRSRDGSTGVRQIAVQNVGMGVEAVLYQRMWLKFDAGMLARAKAAGASRYDLTFWEAAARPDYRIRLGLAYDPTAGLVWRAQADRMDHGTPLWEAALASVPVVLAAPAAAEGWHKVEIWMDRPNGRFTAAIDGHTLVDRSGNLMGTSGNRLDQLRMMMAHDAAGPFGEVLFDDLEMWDTPPADAWGR